MSYRKIRGERRLTPSLYLSIPHCAIVCLALKISLIHNGKQLMINHFPLWINQIVMMSFSLS